MLPETRKCVDLGRFDGPDRDRAPENRTPTRLVNLRLQPKSQTFRLQYVQTATAGSRRVIVILVAIPSQVRGLRMADGCGWLEGLDGTIRHGHAAWLLAIVCHGAIRVRTVRCRPCRQGHCGRANRRVRCAGWLAGPSCRSRRGGGVRLAHLSGCGGTARCRWRLTGAGIPVVAPRHGSIICCQARATSLSCYGEDRCGGADHRPVRRGQDPRP
jgi:hypothetical protein